MRAGPVALRSLPASYMPDPGGRSSAVEAARLAPSFDALMQLAREWRESHGPLPDPTRRMMLGE
jgi:hypothetical protein